MHEYIDIELLCAVCLIAVFALGFTVGEAVEFHRRRK